MSAYEEFSHCSVCCSMLREISELESIGDACYNIARTINRKVQGKQDHFNERQYEHLHQMMELTENSLTQMNNLMGGRKESFDVNRSFNIENEINNYRNQLKSQNISGASTSRMTPSATGNPSPLPIRASLVCRVLSSQ